MCCHSDILEISQINLQHSKSASFELRKQLAVKHTDIVFIQEPYLLDGRVHGLDMSCGRILRKEPISKTRACIFISNNVNVSLIQECSSDDLAAALLKINDNGVNRIIVVAAVYLPYDSVTPPPSQDLRKLIAWCKLRNYPLVLGCDVNAHHSVWGCEDTNDRGETLFEFLITTDLEILNRGNEPTFVNALRSTIIDVTFCSQSLVSKIINWKVTDEILTSDHRCIRFNISITRPLIQPHRNRRLTNWLSFKENLSRNLGPVSRINGIEDIEAEANMVGAAVNAAFEASCPLIANKSGVHKPFWNAELKKLRKLTRTIKNRARKTDSQEDWACFWNHQKLYKKELRMAQRKAWVDYCESISSIPVLARMNKVLSKNASAQPDVLRLPNGNLTKSSKEVAEHLLRSHFPGCTLVEPNKDNSMEVGAVWKIHLVLKPFLNTADDTRSCRMEWTIPS